MIRYFVGRQIDAAETKLGMSLDYLRHILRVSLPDLFRVRRLAS